MAGISRKGVKAQRKQEQLKKFGTGGNRENGDFD
jgi:hypothetical protein